MSNAADSVRTLISETKVLRRAVEDNADVMAELLRGQLRSVSSRHLDALKRELRDYNIHTGNWRRP